jgi:hypothetical protein
MSYAVIKAAQTINPPEPKSNRYGTIHCGSNIRCFEHCYVVGTTEMAWFVTVLLR